MLSPSITSAWAEPPAPAPPAPVTDDSNSPEPRSSANVSSLQMGSVSAAWNGKEADKWGNVILEEGTAPR